MDASTSPSAADAESEPTDVPEADPTDAPDVDGSVVASVGRGQLLVAAALVLLALGGVVALVISPEGIGDLVTRVAAGVILTGLGASLALGGAPARTLGRITSSVLLAAGAVLLLLDPDRWIGPLGRILGVGLVLVGLGVIVGVSEGARAWSRRSRMRLGAGLVVTGTLTFFLLETFSDFVAVSVVALSVGTAVVRAGIGVGLVSVDDPTTGTRLPVLVRWIEGKGKTSLRREDIYEQVFFEGATAPARIGRFFLMMLFASVISAAGVMSDSTAVVIGAMLVAPLISPMMGMGLSLATGWPNRLGRSTLIVLGGVAIAVGVGALLAAAGIPVDLAGNSQIVSRSSPRVVDLVIAIAAGSAGAYAISRKDASSSLPGVAVAIALVPPLSVVGITMQGGDWEQAAGTLLLFLTNLVAIILAGGVVFIFTGVVPLRRFAENQHRVRTSFGAVAVLALLVVGGLVINGRQIAQDSFDEDEAQQVVLDWLGQDSGFDVVSLDVEDGEVAVVLAGPGDPPQAVELVEDLSESLDTDVRLNLQWIPRKRVIVVSDI